MSFTQHFTSSCRRDYQTGITGKNVACSIFFILFTAVGYFHPGLVYASSEGISPAYTLLVNKDGGSAVAIVATKSNRYASEVKTLQQAIQKNGGSRIKILQDDKVSLKDLISNQSLILLGNMSTSLHIRLLYEQWYTLLDLKYPGPGGSVVRTLHNPYATGHDIILLGGSDDAGVQQAVHEFISELPNSRPLYVKSQFKIRLGNKTMPPAPGKPVFSWDDSWRIDAKGKSYGYPPATYFGWNPISANAALYYMTGKPEYLDHFLELALPNAARIPNEIKKASLEGTPGEKALLHPIAYWHHYTSHNFPLIWDLIKDSPGISREQKDAINHDLLTHTHMMAQQFNKVAKNSKGKGLTRHGLYYALNLYTASRYFNKLQPDGQWNEHLAAVKKSMDWWLREPTWGEMDTVEWISTSIEPVFTYFTLSGYQEFIDSGVADKLIATLDALWQGDPTVLSNKYQSISLMNKAAWLLNDNRYAWFAQQSGYDFSQFRIGQSWWPAYIPERISPTEAFSIIKTAQSDARRLALAINKDESFQFLAWRSGYGPDDDYLLVDGLNQGGRHPHHVAALTYLRHGDKPLLSGYENQLFVLRDGLSGNHVPKAAALDRAIELGNAVYIRTMVPNGPFASWQRHILHFPDDTTLVADTVSAKQPGNYELLRQWKTVGWSKPSEGEPRNIAVQGEGRVTITTDKAVTNRIDGARIDQRLYTTLDDSESITLFSSIHTNPATGRARDTLEPVDKNAALLKEGRLALIAAGPYTSAGFSSDATFSYLSTERLVVIGGKKLATDDVLIAAEDPVSINWQLDRGDIVITTDNKTTVKLSVSHTSTPALVSPAASMTANDGILELTLPAGTYNLTGIHPQDGQIQLMRKALARPGSAALKDKPDTTVTLNWSAKKIAEFTAPVTHIVAESKNDSLLWVVTGEPKPALHLITREGETLRTIPLSGPVNAVAMTGATKSADIPWLITGSQDNILRAFNHSGDLLWLQTSKIAKEFRQGSTYYAPWFTDPKKITGIHSLLVADTDNNGEKEIVVGRPSTVEYWNLDGSLLQRIPMPSGDRLGTISEIGLLETDRGKRVLLGQDHCGIDAISLLDEHRNFVTIKNSARPYLNPLPANSTDMTAWGQRGISSLDIADLDLDGKPEVIVSRSGHWNDLRIYSTDGSACRWMHAFGPADPLKTQQENGERFIRDTLVADVAGDNKQEVTVALDNGYILVFSEKGEALWTGNHEEPAILGVSNNHLIAGFDDGSLQAFDLTNNQTSTAQLGSEITSLETHGNSGSLYAGTIQGALFTLGPASFRH